MKRRQFLKKAGIAVAASTTFGTVYAQAQPRIRWRMATHWPRALDVLFGGAERLARRVEAATDGRFQISVHPAGELVPAPEIFDTVRLGRVEMGHSATYFWMGKNPSLGFTTLPFGLTTPQQHAWLYFGGGLEAVQRVAADFNIIHFPVANTTQQMGGWFKRELRGLEDVSGLKFRAPGFGGEVWSRLGATVILLPAGEIFLALERGTVDGAEFVGPHDDVRLGLHRAARYYYYPGWHEPAATLDLMINLDSWRTLPREYQEIVKSAAAEANLTVIADYYAKNGPAMEQLLQGGTQLRRFPDSILLAAQRATEEALDEIAGRDATFRDNLTGWRRFRDIVRKVPRVGEFAFEEFIYAAR